jgi:hypothetical protein
MKIPFRVLVWLNPLIAPVSDAVEGRLPVAITCDRLTVDDARLGSQPRQRFDNQR